MQESRRIFHYKHFYLYHFTFWLILCIVVLFRDVAKALIAGKNFNWEQVIHWPIAYFLSFWLLSFSIINIYLFARNYPGKYQIIVHGMASVIFGFAHFMLTGISTMLLERLFQLPETYAWNSLLLFWKANFLDATEGIGFYWVCLIILSALDYYNRYKNQQDMSSHLESKLVSSQLQTLKMQLKPHFLFNALNTIAMMVRRNNLGEAVNMISGLSDMLRNSLGKEKKQYVTVEEEIDLVKKYLKIEAIRFQDRLKVDFKVDREVLHCAVPNLLLQPIVENAFKHGISRNINNALIEICALQENGAVALSVFNTGSSLPPDWDLSSSKGIGIVNTTHRLRQLYNGQFKFVVKEQNGGIIFKIILPLTKLKK